jgi:CRISPR-associated protein Cas2
MPYALIAYDITSDRRRAEVSALLSEFGPRVQLSVFEIEFPGPRVRADLLRRLADLIDDDEDQVRVYDLHSLTTRRTILGDRVLEERQPFYLI